MFARFVAKLFAANRTPIRNARRTRLNAEALEARDVPASYFWDGSASSLSGDPDNWTSPDAPGTVPSGSWVSVSSVGSFQATSVAQQASHWPASLRNSARRWQTASAPDSDQRIPVPFSRWFTTCLHAASTGPLPMSHPFAR
jgi:hypothetical protein